MQPRNKQFYDKLGNLIMQILRTTYPNIEIKKVGSRESGTFQRDSDLDIRFYFNGGNPSKEKFYPKLVALLTNKLKMIDGELINYDIGTHGNVVRCRPVNGGKVDLVLVSETDY